MALKSPIVEETARNVANDIYDAKTNYVTEGGTPLFPHTPERHFLLHQDRHDGKRVPPSPSGSGSGKSRKARALGSMRGGEWFYCDGANAQEPRGPITTIKLVELARKGIVNASSWVWSQDEQPYWIRFPECQRFKDLQVVKNAFANKTTSSATPGNGSAVTSSSSRGKASKRGARTSARALRTRRREREEQVQVEEAFLKQQNGSENRSVDVGAGAKKSTRRGNKRNGYGSSRPDPPAVALAPAPAPAASGGGGAFESGLSWERSIENAQAENELDRANLELRKAMEKIDTKDSKLKEYKSKIKVLKEELKIREDQISIIRDEKENKPGGNAAFEDDSILRAQLEIAEMKLREQDHLLEQKNQEIKKLEITVAETDSELTKARIALSKELSWLLEESASGQS